MTRPGFEPGKPATNHLSYGAAITSVTIRRGADKSSAFPVFLFATQPKEFFFDGLKKLEQRSHKCVELRGEYVE
jgi:hypothetical protein